MGDAIFGAHGSELSQQRKKQVAAVTAAVKLDAPDRDVAVEGHASAESGVPDGDSDRLPQQGADRVRDALIIHRISDRKIVIRHFGSHKPAVPTDIGEARQEDRRVTIVIERGRFQQCTAIGITCSPIQCGRSPYLSAG